MPRIYTIKKGDELNKLAEKWGISISSLLAANTGVSSITPGVTLRIPTRIPLDTIVPPEVQPPVIPPTPPVISDYDPYGRRPTPEKPPGPIPPTPYVPPPYVPPPPASGDYGPKGYPKEPGTQLPFDVKPPPYVPPPYLPSRVPVGRGAQLPQPPAVNYTQQQERLGLAPQPPAGQAQQRPEVPLWQPQPGSPQLRIMGYLNRLFAARPQRRNLQRGQPVVPWYAPQPGGFQERAYNLALDPTQENLQGAIQAAGAGVRGLGERIGIPDSSENAINRIAEAQAQGQTNGTQWVRYMMADGNTRMFNWSWNEETTEEELLEQRASHVGQSLRASDRPQIILESDRRILDLSLEDMQNMGYFWDEEKGHWVFGEVIEEPQTYGAASLPGWGYNYPPRRGGGGGGGGYSYPSYLPREQVPFPQSFVGREQPGGIPQQAQTRAARFGAITWRI